MNTSHARVHTERASEYLVRLSKEWAHDIPALTFNDNHAIIPFPGALCELVAGKDFLDITLMADSQPNAILMEHLVGGQLDSVALDEHLKYDWAFQ